MLFIRADANEYIGTGHVMRCLSIAQAFKVKGEKVIFITADHRGDELITQKGFPVICLETEWTDMEGEVQKLKDQIAKYKPVLLLVDSYYVTSAYFNELKKSVHIAYIDDINANCWNIDYLIDYNIFALTFDYSSYAKSSTKLLLGPKYAPLRREFKSLPPHVIKDNVINILISAGGADPQNVTEKIMQEICIGHPQIQFHFIIGALNQRIEIIKAQAPKNAVLHINEQKMAELMKLCDIAVSAAGTTLYELCAAGIPTITYVLADNQIVAAKQFEKQGIMLNAGDCRGNRGFVKTMHTMLESLSYDVDKRKILSNNMQNLVDGHGTIRICSAIEET